MSNGVDPCAIQFTFENCNYRKLGGKKTESKLVKFDNFVTIYCNIKD